VLFDEIASVYILFEKYVSISASEMASPENQHCAGCIVRKLSSIAFGAVSLLLK